MQTRTITPEVRKQLDWHPLRTLRDMEGAYDTPLQRVVDYAENPSEAHVQIASVLCDVPVPMHPLDDTYLYQWMDGETGQIFVTDSRSYQDQAEMLPGEGKDYRLNYYNPGTGTAIWVNQTNGQTAQTRWVGTFRK